MLLNSKRQITRFDLVEDFLPCGMDIPTDTIGLNRVSLFGEKSMGTCKYQRMAPIIAERYRWMLGDGNPMRRAEVALKVSQKMSIFRKGKKASLETRKKLSEIRQGEGNSFFGKHHSEETKKKLAEFRCGKRHSRRTKRKISEGQRGEKNQFFGKHHSEETKKKLAERFKGKSLSDKVKRKISKRLRGMNIIRFLGGHHSDEAKRRISIAMKGNQYAKGYNIGNKYAWKGGTSSELYPKEFIFNLKERIRDRDGRECRACNLSEIDYRRKLDIHHIDYNKKNCNDSNLVSLCFPCHSRTNNNRDYWIHYFGGMGL